MFQWKKDKLLRDENRKSACIDSEAVNSETKVETQDPQDGFKNLPKWKQDKILRERKIAEEKLKKEQEEIERNKSTPGDDEAAECQSDDAKATESLIERSNQGMEIEQLDNEDHELDDNSRMELEEIVELEKVTNSEETVYHSGDSKDEETSDFVVMENGDEDALEDDGDLTELESEENEEKLKEAALKEEAEAKRKAAEEKLVEERLEESRRMAEKIAREKAEAARKAEAERQEGIRIREAEAEAARKKAEEEVEVSSFTGMEMMLVLIVVLVMVLVIVLIV